MKMNENVRLFDLAFALAYFLHPFKETAVEIAKGALAKLPEASQRQAKTLTRYKPKERRHVVVMEQQHLLQRLVFAQSETYELRRQRDPLIGVTSEDMLIWYVKHLVRLFMKFGSFHAIAGVARVLHEYRTGDTLDMYATVAPNRAEHKDDDRCRAVKKELMEGLQTRFGKHLKVVSVDKGRESRFVRAADCGKYWNVVKESLERFVPWSTKHILTDWHGRVPPEDLCYGGQPDGEHLVEIDRLHAVVDPLCFSRLTEEWALDPPWKCVWVPQFFWPSEPPPLSPFDPTPPPNWPSGTIQTLGNWAGDRYNAPEIPEHDIEGVLEEIRADRERLQQVSTRSLFVVVDGVKQSSFSPADAHGARFHLRYGDEIVEVLADDDETLSLVTYLMTYDEAATEASVRHYEVGDNPVSIVIPTFEPQQQRVSFDIAFGPGALHLPAALAVRSLTVAQFLKLRNYARWRMRPLGAKAAGREGEDLLSEALTATIEGRRTWKQGIDFPRHLVAAMRSISTSWRKKRGEEIPFSQFASEEGSPFERAVTTLEPERLLAAKEELEKVRHLFVDNPGELTIVELLGEGWTGREIRDHLAMSAREYGATTKRIRRKLHLLRTR